METLLVQTSATAEWLALVNDAQNAAARPLDEELQSYLVFLLVRFTERPELAGSVLGLEYLQSQHLHGRMQQDQLRDVGDKCLLYSGLFPRRAERRRVKISYFVELGRSAYSQLAERLQHSTADMYHHLSATFVPLMDVLHAIREMSDPEGRLQPLHAYDLWRDTGSTHALRSLRDDRDALPIAIPDTRDSNEH